ncbi:olfactory receptor 4D5-like [Osmerus eperlanus]|uniref:olfactory receptor 4D5-like n=1 Tax=Osmerus eperlanus TaxID=29151 RepID=UPI002E0F63E1
MPNDSLILAAYSEIFEQRYIFASVLILLYPVTIVGNMFLIYTICTDRSLHKPMYILIANLSCIGVYGGLFFTPSVLFCFFTGNYQISRVFCLMQVFNVNTYGGCEISNLMLMAYDRYISICFPLNYAAFMTPTKCCITLSLTASLSSCGRIIEKVYCDNYSLVKLACSDISHLSIYSTTVTFFSVVLPFFVILYSYLRIILVCVKLTNSGQTKVIKTCIPHLVAIGNFLIGCSFELYQSRFNMNFMPYTIRVALSLYFLIVSPAMNPIIYGARTENISNAIYRKMFWTKHFEG